MIISRSVLPTMRIFSDKRCRGNNNTHFVFSNFFFFRKFCLLRDNVEIYCRLGQGTSHKMTHEHSILDNQATHTHTHTYTFTLRLTVFNTYCFSTATVIARMHLHFPSHAHCFCCCASLGRSQRKFAKIYPFNFVCMSVCLPVWAKPRTARWMESVRNSML